MYILFPWVSSILLLKFFAWLWFSFEFSHLWNVLLNTIILFGLWPKLPKMVHLLHIRNASLNLPRVVLISVCSAFILVCLYARNIREIPRGIIQQHMIKQPGESYRISKGPLPSVNLVIAATSKEDYSWVKELKVSRLVVIPYIADNTTAPHHAQKNKGTRRWCNFKTFTTFTRICRIFRFLYTRRRGLGMWNRFLIRAWSSL